MDQKITRNVSSGTVTVALGAALSGAFDFRGYAGGTLKTPAALDATTKIAFAVSDDLNGTYTALYDDSDTLVEITVTLNASRVYPLPDELFGAHYVKLWCEASGTGVNQAAARVFTLCLKG